jgi:hypothetical protein
MIMKQYYQFTTKVECFMINLLTNTNKPVEIYHKKESKVERRKMEGMNQFGL